MPRYNGQAHCKACGKAIKFIETPRKKQMPVDMRPFTMEPHPDGDARLVNSQGEMVRCFIVDPGPYYDPHKIGYRPHWETCPEAPRFKAEAERAARIKQEREERQAAEEAKREEREALARQISFY